MNDNLSTFYFTKKDLRTFLRWFYAIDDKVKLKKHDIKTLERVLNQIPIEWKKEKESAQLIFNKINKLDTLKD